MKKYSFTRASIENLQPSKLKLLMSDLNWATGADSRKIALNDRGYRVNNSENSNSHENNVAAIGFFSGAGGLEIGAHLAGVNVISSMDFDKDSVATLSANRVFSNSQIIHGDIRESKGSDYRKIIKESKSKKLILIGGPVILPFIRVGKSRIYAAMANRWFGVNPPKAILGLS